MKEKRNTGIAFRLMSIVFFMAGSLPLWMLYGVSDFVAFLAGRVFGYRRGVIRKNLSASFPEKSRKELLNIEKGFYRFLGDYFVETLKLGRMSEKQIRKRMSFIGQEDVNECLVNGQNVSLLLGHYGNWEWISSIPLHLPSGFHAGQIYHPLENVAADQVFLNLRGRFGAESIKMKDTLPTVMNWRREGKPFIIGYIADQVPFFDGMHYFADFLNQDTPAFTGHERISRMLHASVFYCDIQRPRRGEYVCRYIKMTDDAAGLPQFELTKKYYEMLEATIRRTPHLWLWSHNRWKRTRQGFYEYYGREEAEKRLSRL
ncbi:MAG: lysophospholipid acyltransferase family protein [Muribaculaceae bacterium]|nr:lysophospholipid acyltransferase family protein [Muribaculaceae bacterium]